jgi:iron complex transport system ATP-binding protein
MKDGGAAKATALEVSGLSCGYGQPLVQELGFGLQPGEALAVVGPNGSGKTTLLRTLAGQLPPLEGHVTVQGRAVHRLDHARRARLVTLLSQEDPGDGSLTVRELVELGRTPYLGLWGRGSPEDDAAVEQALEACQLLDLAHRRLDRISGGERQRARIAMTLAQQTAVVLLDEPVNHLDLRRRFDFFELVSTLRRERRLATVIVLHELAEAYREADRVLVLDPARRRGVEVGRDDPERVARLARVFEVPEDRIQLG